MEFGTVLIAVMNFIPIWSHQVNIEGKEPYLGDFIRKQNSRILANAPHTLLSSEWPLLSFKVTVVGGNELCTFFLPTFSIDVNRINFSAVAYHLEIAIPAGWTLNTYSLPAITSWFVAAHTKFILGDQNSKKKILFRWLYEKNTFNFGSHTDFYSNMIWW